MHSQQTGLVKTIGGAHQLVLFPESLDMPRLVQLMAH